MELLEIGFLINWWKIKRQTVSLYQEDLQIVGGTSELCCLAWQIVQAHSSALDVLCPKITL